MADTPEITGLEALRSQSSKVQLPSGSRFLLITSVEPQSVFASAVLSRSILRSGGSLHVTFSEPVIDTSTLVSETSMHDDLSILCVGLTPVNLQDTDALSKLIFLAPSLDVSEISCLGVSHSVISVSLAFALEQFIVNKTDCKISAIGIAAMMDSSSIETAPEARAIVDYVIENELLVERPEFLLYGANFMPVRDSLSSSIHPYLEGISGESTTCEAILDEANIPRARRSYPLTSLKKDERQQITSALILRIDPSILAEVIGANYEIPSEKKDGPLRWTSSVRVLSMTAWSRREYGVAMSVWMGDRARSLRSLLDGHIAHANSVLNTLHDITPSINEGALNIRDMCSTVSISNGTGTVLSEIGRILLMRGSIKSKFLSLQSNEAIVFSWRPSEIQLTSVLSALYSDEMYPCSTSYGSIVFDPSIDKEAVIASLYRVVDSS